MSNKIPMMPAKRSHDGIEKEPDSRTSPFMPMFEVFRNELDEHHDRRERIIKASRDITAASKKMLVFCPLVECWKLIVIESSRYRGTDFITSGLGFINHHRVRSLKGDLPPKIAAETQERAAAMNKQFISIAPDLAGINAWRYQRQISGGIQEYMEAISFEQYLRHQTLISIEEARKTLPESIDLTGDDYILGIFDLVGELMRFAITTMATTGSLPGSRIDDGQRDILMDLRSLRTSFQALDTTSSGGTGLGKDVEKKMEVMKTCVEKVETAVYGMIIRGRERPKGWLPDLSDDRGAVEGY